MRETVVSIMRQADNAGMIVYLESGGKHPNADDSWPLLLRASDMPPLDTSTNVTAYGKAVHSALTQHPAIGHELVEILGCECSALKFLIKAPNGEHFRWETILGNEPIDTCTITRITSARSGPGPRIFDFPLRMAAFLSAAGVSAKEEEKKIREQILAAQEKKLPIECTFYLGEQQLLEDRQKDIADGTLKDKGITFEAIPPTAFEITKLLKNTEFQFLHFFCHGIARAGVRALKLATINDHDRNEANKNAAEASIFLSIDALSESLVLKNSIWMTVFNSCSSAEAVLGLTSIRGLHSIALEVAKKGCPYTIGMAEPIDHDDATAFSEGFYEELFAIVKKTLVAGEIDKPLILNLCPAMIPARKKIYDHWLMVRPITPGAGCGRSFTRVLSNH